jgi:hypothetical protein
MTLGMMAFTRMPSRAYSASSASTSASTAALPVMYPAAPGNGRTAARLDTHTSAPVPAVIRCGRAAWAIV